MTDLLMRRSVDRPAAPPGPQRVEASSAISGSWRSAWALLVPAIVVAYGLGYLRFPAILGGGLNLYLAQPATWLSVGLLGYMGWRYGLCDREAGRNRFVGLAVLLGAFQIAVSIFTGFLSRFGYSPYGHQAEVLLGNLLYAGTMLVGIELSRAYLIGLVGRDRPVAGLLLISLLFTVVGIAPGMIGGLSGPLSLFEFGGTTFLPLMAQNLLATMLALLGGPLAAIGFRAVIEIFEWSSPILPNPPWAFAALAGTLGPVIGMLVVQAQTRPSQHAGGSRTSQWPSAWLVPAFLGVLMIWFNQGLFGVRPTLVSGVSMAPLLQAGDLVLTAEVEPEEIVVGDIVRFRAGDSYVLHRVIAIRSEGSLEFITQGDANNVSDPPLIASAVEGRVVSILPGFGWPSIGVRMGLQWVLDRVGL
jgi:signal peptidase